MKQYTVLLKDYVNPGKDGMNEKVVLDIEDGETIKQAAEKWMKKAYGGKTYMETGEKNGKHYKFIFSTECDWFLCWQYLPKQTLVIN